VRRGQRITGMVASQSRLAVQAQPLRLPARREERHAHQRSAPLHRRDRRRHLPRPLDAHRGDQPRPRRSRSSRPAARQPGRPSDGRLDRLRARRRQPTTCPRSSCCVTQASRRAASRSTPAAGAAASCRAATRACSSAAPATPVLYLDNPAGVTRERGARMLDALAGLNTRHLQPSSATPRSTRASPSTRWRSACRRSVPEPGRPLRRTGRGHGSTLRARRARTGHLRRQLPPRAAARSSAACGSCSSIHRGWDQHGNLTERAPARQCTRPTSRRPRWSQDLKQRGLLDDTLVVWGGEFGRTPLSPGRAQPRATTAATTTAALLLRSGWPAAASSPASRLRRDRRLRLQHRRRIRVHVHDLQATMLHLLGIDHDAAHLPLPGPPASASPTCTGKSSVPCSPEFHARRGLPAGPLPEFPPPFDRLHATGCADANVHPGDANAGRARLR
jgi:hypothetical protein